MTSELIEFDRSRRQGAPRADESTASGASNANPARRPLAIEHILAPFDGSTLAECTVRFVMALARAFSSRVTLIRTLEQAVPTTATAPPVDALEWELARAEAHAGLTRLQKTLERQGLRAAVEVVQGRAAEQIAHFACANNADLIVLSSHGEGGLHGWGLASTVHKIVFTTHASVLVVPAHRFHNGNTPSAEFRKILVPLDCSSRAECILPAATELAKAHGAQLILAHVVLEPEMPRRMPPSCEDLQLAGELVQRNRREAEHYLRELQSRLAASTDADIRLVVAPHRTRALRDLAKQEGVDLVVLCAHGSTGDPNQRYGGVAAKFLQEADTPVMVLQDLASIVQPRVAADTVGAERPGH